MRLRRYNTPTISNAIELFDVRPRHIGFLPHTIRCLLPDLGPIVGYAVTSRTRASRPEPTEAKVDLLGDYLRYVASVPGPKIAVGWDLDEPPGWVPSSARSRRRSTRSSAASATSPAAARATSTRSRRSASSSSA